MRLELISLSLFVRVIIARICASLSSSEVTIGRIQVPLSFPTYYFSSCQPMPFLLLPFLLSFLLLLWLLQNTRGYELAATDDKDYSKMQVKKKKRSKKDKKTDLEDLKREVEMVSRYFHRFSHLPSQFLK